MPVSRQTTTNRERMAMGNVEKASNLAETDLVEDVRPGLLRWKVSGLLLWAPGPVETMPRRNCDLTES